MLNRPRNDFSEKPRPEWTPRDAWDVDARPTARLWWLGTLMSLPLLAISARVAWLQVALADTYLDALDISTTTVEPIPAADGRILTSDGQVLADNSPRFDIFVHYRWVEQPANAAWLKQEAVSRLPRSERRSRDRIRESSEQVLAEREAMWARLATVTGVPAAKVADRRAALQQRVERIASSVSWGRREADWSREFAARPAEAPPRHWLGTAWSELVAAVTTPPRREHDDPLVVREELEPHLLFENVPFPVAAEIQVRPDDFPGVRIEASAVRTYPHGPLAAHLVGRRGPIADEALAERRARYPGGDPLDYRPGDRIGQSGVERSWDERLRGVRGARTIVRNRRGEVESEALSREPRPGSDVVLTLHSGLQRRAEAILDDALAAQKESEENVDPESPAARAIRGAGGAIVVLDIQTGAVVAAASAPRFDLGLFLHPDSDAWRSLIDDPRRPFFDRATRMALPPGSVFKPLTAVALLQSGRIDPEHRRECAGYLDRPDRNRCYVFSHFGVGHGPVNLSDALAQSCNVYFYDGARTIGPQPIVVWAERFGFGEPTGIDLPGEAPGSLPRPPQSSATRAAKANERWQPGDTLGLAIGQSRLLATPLQIARMMAAIANGGRLVTPHVVRPNPESGGDGSIVLVSHEAPAAPPIAGLDPETLERVRDGLDRVVSDPRGTGHKTVRMDQVAIAGKTGTAEVGGGRPDHAWFAGYVPAKGPRWAFVVVLEHAGSGGRAAGPAAKRLVQELLETGMLSPAK